MNSVLTLSRAYVRDPSILLIQNLLSSVSIAERICGPCLPPAFFLIAQLPPSSTPPSTSSFSMSTPLQPVQELDTTNPGDFVTDDDVLEVEEVEEVGPDGMDVESDDDGAEDGEEPTDDAETMLDNGLDDSKAEYVGHEDAVFAVALHPLDSLIAVSGGGDDMGHIWRTDNGEELARLDGHTDSVTSVGFNFDGEMVATGGMDGKVRVWRRKGEGYLNWEFVIGLEGPEEVNVSLGDELGGRES